MIAKQGNGYVVKSEDGSKTLSKPTTKAKAEKRLAQIEYFKKKRARSSLR